ncbi:hypothetical protein LIBAT_03015 [Leptospira interrogans]
MVPFGLENRGLDAKHLPQDKKANKRNVMKRKVCRNGCSQRNISIAYLPSNSKEMVKEQVIKHNEVQIKKFINKLKTEWNEIHCCYDLPSLFKKEFR